MHHTKDKGDLAVAKVIADLTEKGYVVYLPISEHSKSDLIAENGQIYRIQVKYSKDGFVRNKTSWADKNGSHAKKYKLTDFDYYAMYLAEIDVVIYPSISFGGCMIRTKEPQVAGKYYWFEDFVTITDGQSKRVKPKKIVQKRARVKINWPNQDELINMFNIKTLKEIATEINCSIATVKRKQQDLGLAKTHIKQEKIKWPTPEELKQIVWEKPTSVLANELGVTDSAIGKRCKRFNIPKPPRGYWEKQYHKK